VCWWGTQTWRRGPPRLNMCSTGVWRECRGALDRRDGRRLTYLGHGPTEGRSYGMWDTSCPRPPTRSVSARPGLRFHHARSRQNADTGCGRGTGGWGRGAGQHDGAQTNRDGGLQLTQLVAHWFATLSPQSMGTDSGFSGTELWGRWDVRIRLSAADRIRPAQSRRGKEEEKIARCDCARTVRGIWGAGQIMMVRLCDLWI